MTTPCAILKMPFDAPLLSICIATMNRSAQLNCTLRALLLQIDDDCEIVVVDGNSGDTTAQVAVELTRTSRHLRYHRESVNSGVDADYDRAVGYATGRYCWLLTDDDQLLPGAVGSILAALRRHEPSLLLVNARVADAESNEEMVERRLEISADRVYREDEFEIFFRDCVRYLSFIGAVVIRREIWQARERQRYFGTAFIHLGVIFQARLPGAVVALSEPGLVLQYGVAGWRKRAFEIWVIRWPQLIWSFETLSEDARASICPRAPWGDLRYILLHRALGNFGPEQYRDFVAGRLPAGARKTLAWIAAYTPAGLLNKIATLYLDLSNRSAPMLRRDLQEAACKLRGQDRSS